MRTIDADLEPALERAEIEPDVDRYATVALDLSLGLERALAAAERHVIARALSTHGSLSTASRALGVSRYWLRRHAIKHGLREG